jgi:hypothetical protein
VLLLLLVCVVLGGAGGLKEKVLDRYLSTEKHVMKLE